ncbi:MAG: hypothetical protein IPH18_10925 [Chitinophagaceae bacterium]|nr:hypothetical protein [Chitinophagaceae bacterium]
MTGHPQKSTTFSQNNPVPTNLRDGIIFIITINAAYQLIDSLKGAVFVTETVLACSAATVWLLPRAFSDAILVLNGTGCSWMAALPLTAGD